MAVVTPPFSSLPLNASGPIGNAWGLFGLGNQLGTINRLTAETTKAAIAEIEHGIRVTTDWSLDTPMVPPFQRQAFNHTFVDKSPRTVNDDIINFNTQDSSQWDGLRHYGYQSARVFYNGVTQQQIHEPGSLVNGIQNWVESGGIVGRGVLLDYAAWMASQGKTYDVFTTTEITAADLDAIVAEQNVTFKPGDILFIRSNFTTRLEELTQDAQNNYTGSNPLLAMGVKSEEATLKWIWEREFAAVASDMVAFEITPFVNTTFLLHEWLLGGWGMPIGELFDLKKLAETAAQLKKYTFFFSSVPLNVPGGVASPPNGVAIF